MFAGRGSVCMACGIDLWDVERYVSAGGIVICQSCLDALKRAADASEAIGEIEVDVPLPPPRVRGVAPDGEAVASITRAFVRTFDSDEDQLQDDLEDASELGVLLAQARGRAGLTARFGARVDGIRFLSADRAEVRYQVLMNGNPMGSFQGSSSCRDGCWRVTRQTVSRLFSSYGVAVPPRRT